MAACSAARDEKGKGAGSYWPHSSLDVKGETTQGFLPAGEKREKTPAAFLSLSQGEGKGISLPWPAAAGKKEVRRVGVLLFILSREGEERELSFSGGGKRSSFRASFWPPNGKR